VIGDWMGSLYDISGRRHDCFLFLDHDGRYERTVRREPGFERRDTGRWELDDDEHTLRLTSDTPEDPNSWERISSSWRVLSVTGCEESNVMLVLREAVLASRNLPIILYRVHCNHRGYGTGWEERHAEELARQASASGEGR
jgi:hypothetical protein